MPQEEARIIRDQNTLSHPERKAEVTPGARTQRREINAGPQEVSRTRRAQGLRGTNTAVYYTYIHTHYHGFHSKYVHECALPARVARFSQ
jgi:hypothetical protein